MRTGAAFFVSAMISRRGYSTAKDILAKSFEKIGASKTYQKTPQELEKLVSAGKTLGISKSIITQAYESVTPGIDRPIPESNESRERTKQFDLEMFDTPSAQQFGRPFEYDDLPSAAHLQLEEHRDVRALVRAAAYELPLLSQYKSEYRRPTATENLRFRYYAFAQEDHPAAKKVVLEFEPESTGLKDAALHKLKLLAGPRYHNDVNRIKISCDKFPNQTQNKRYLGNIYARLLETAQDKSDMFADIPLDPRPNNRRERNRKSLYPKFEFPQEWNRPDKAPKKREDIIAALSE